MDPRISIITLGVAELERSLRFYRVGLRWPLSSASAGDIAFFRTGGVVLALYPRALLAADAHLAAGASSGFGGITLAHNVTSKDAVDAAIADALAAGGTLLKAAEQADWGGYSGYFADPAGYPWEVAWNPFFPMDADGRIVLPE
ncbi:MAG: VOC family protein [Ktedonobacterales bacterium]